MSEENIASLSLDRVLLPRKSLHEYGLRAEDATLYSVIKFLSLKSSQRSARHIAILQLLTSSIQFFQEKTKEIGPSVHIECCTKMTYEFFPQDSVFLI
jgi:CRP-like cAMP-binding protein